MISINGTLLFQFLNFFVLVAILAKFAYKPMLKVLEERRNKISSDLNDAEQSRLAAEKLKADYEQQLQTAQEKAQAIIDKAVKQAEAGPGFGGGKFRVSDAVDMGYRPLETKVGVEGFV